MDSVNRNVLFGLAFIVVIAGVVMALQILSGEEVGTYTAPCAVMVVGFFVGLCAWAAPENPPAGSCAVDENTGTRMTDTENTLGGGGLDD